MLGFGVGGTYRVNKKWSIYSDLAYQVTTSAIGNRTGQGTGNNGYFDINLGVQLDLGNNRFYRVAEKTNPGKNDVMTNSFWSNWFAQTGIGMSLLNVYGCNFAHVFPNGKTLGINLGIGKWFTPEFGLRGGINWQNGIIGNNHLEWLDAENQPGSNHDRGGFGAIYVDGFFNLHNIFGEYSETRKWNAIIFPRAGLDSNFETSSGSPLIGIGMEHTFYLNNRLKLYADLAYQVTSSEFVQMKYESNHKDGNSNGWFDINIGVQYELGKSKGRFRKITSRYTGE
jgi:hypothetical protein